MKSPVKQAMLDRLVQRWTPLLKGVQDPPGEDAPSWVKHGMEMIRRAQLGPHPLHDPIVSVQPMPRPIGGVAFYRPEYGKPQWEPSAVDRLGALAEPAGELAKRIAEWDEEHTFDLKTFDMVTDPAVPGAVP